LVTLTPLGSGGGALLRYPHSVLLFWRARVLFIQSCHTSPLSHQPHCLLISSFSLQVCASRSYMHDPTPAAAAFAALTLSSFYSNRWCVVVLLLSRPTPLALQPCHLLTTSFSLQVHAARSKTVTTDSICSDLHPCRIEVQMLDFLLAPQN
jgi:hypothetical protein